MNENGNSHRMWPGIARPPMLFVTELGRVFLVQDCQTGVTVHVGIRDSGAVRAALDAAFTTIGVPVRVPPIVRPRV